MDDHQDRLGTRAVRGPDHSREAAQTNRMDLQHGPHVDGPHGGQGPAHRGKDSQPDARSEEHTSELQSQSNLVCRLLLEKKKKKRKDTPQRKPDLRRVTPTPTKLVGLTHTP